MLFIYSVIFLMTPINQNEMLLISENINSILNYYIEDENIFHKNIMLYSTVNFENSLEVIKTEFPHIIFEYTMLDEKASRFCEVTNSDLSIVIPSNILSQEEEEIFEYKFQSHIKNVFGKLTFEKEIKDGKVIAKNMQIITSSIGN